MDTHTGDNQWETAAAIFNGLPRGAQGELYTRSIRSTSVRFANSQFEGTSQSRNRTITLRVILDGRLSAATTSEPGESAAMELVEKALRAVKYGTAVGYDFPGAAPVAQIPLSDPRVPATRLEEMVAIGRDFLGTLLAAERRLRASAGIEAEEVEVSLVNTAGFAGSYRKTAWHAGCGGQLIQGDDFLRVGESRNAAGPDLDYEDMKKEALRELEWARETVPFGAGSYPVIFAPSQVGFLVTPFLASLNGKAIARGISPWKEKLAPSTGAGGGAGGAERLLDPRVTLVDDGTLPMTITSAPFDREGVPTRRNILIDGGVPVGALLDLQTAKELGRSSTGNATAAGTGAGPHRVLLAPGETPLAEMVAGIDHGLLVLGSMGAWTGNAYSGNVSGTISLGLRIEGGKVAGRVKNCMFSLNAFTHFRDHLAGLSRETKDASAGGPGMGGGGGGATFPYVALDNVVITTK